MSNLALSLAAAAKLAGHVCPKRAGKKREGTGLGSHATLVG
jgi:hypothetical protein